MRVLLDQECAAVAGGNPFEGAEDLSDAGRESFLSSCEEAVTGACVTGGAFIGSAVGSGVPGVGTVGGAIAGASAGQLVATVVAPPVCRNAYKNRYGEGDGGGGSTVLVNSEENTSLTGGPPVPYPPWQLLVNTNPHTPKFT